MDLTYSPYRAGAVLPGVNVTRHAAPLRWALLFVCAALPVFAVDLPPLQDLPNHLGTLEVIRHAERFPEFVVNGFLKTNAALYLWLYAATFVMSAAAAAKIFVLLVLALGAFTYPRVVDVLSGERQGRSASLFVWPFVHGFFVSMGMLDYALAVPLGLEVLLALHAFRAAPSSWGAARVVLLTLVTWYAHVFAVLVVGLLALVEFAQEAFERRSWRSLAPLALLVPAGAASFLVCARQLGEHRQHIGNVVAETVFLPPWELAYNLWAECAWGFTWRSITSLVVVVPFVLGVWRWRQCVAFFSPLALLILACAFCFTPYVATNWYFVNSRFAPFLWVALLVRMPPQLPRWLGRTAVACAALYYVGMFADYRMLELERLEFVSARADVAKGARLLPLVFDPKGHSENTRPLLHAWAYYMTERETTAPLLFAHSRQFAVTYREEPPEQLNHLLLERVPQRFGGRSQACALLSTAGATTDCESLYDQFWTRFWAKTEGQFDHVLLWSPPPEAVARIPASFKLRVERGPLRLYVREEAQAARVVPAPQSAE
jgi:hypothetical protein